MIRRLALLVLLACAPLHAQAQTLWASSCVTIGSTTLCQGGTAATIAGLTLTSPVISGGTIDNAVIGGVTPAAATFAAAAATSILVTGNSFSPVANSVVLRFASGQAEVTSLGPSASNYNPILFNQIDSAGGNNVSSVTINAAHQLLVGSGAADSVVLAGGATGGTLTSSAGTMSYSSSSGTVSLGAGSTQNLTLASTFYDSCTAMTTTAAGLLGCTVSDRRLKNDLGEISPADGLRRILALPLPHRYTFVEGYGPGGVHQGMFAQDVRSAGQDELVQVGPETDLTPDGEFRYDQGEQIANLIAAVKDLASCKLSVAGRCWWH